MNSSKISDISILIVEDEEKLLDSMVEYLQLFFTHVYSAKDGMDAYEIYKKKRPDIVVADIHMPRLDGLSLIRSIRQKDENTKIIITTAHSEQEKLLEAIELNLVKYLIKPIQSDALKTLLLSLVNELRKNDHAISLKEDFYWDRERKKLFQNRNEITLKPRERAVLDLLSSNVNTTVSSIDIYNNLYEDQPERDYSSDAVTSLMKRIRQKLPKGTIRTNYGVGYILETK